LDSRDGGMTAACRLVCNSLVALGREDVEPVLEDGELLAQRLAEG